MNKKGSIDSADFLELLKIGIIIAIGLIIIKVLLGTTP